MAGALLVLPAAGQAARAERDVLSAYLQARAAESFGSPERAAESYDAILAISPENKLLAAQALSQALSAGNRAVALRSARLLDKAGALTPDARLVLLSEALRTKDWEVAGRQIDALEEDDIFGFLAPVLRAWAFLGSGKGDPLASLAGASADPLAASYASEHRPLIMLARGDEEKGTAELLRVAEASGGRSIRLKIAGAALLADRGKRRLAEQLLTGDAEPLAVARQLLRRRKSIPAPIDDASSGAAELLIRVAIDLQRQQVSDVGLKLARLATFMAPANSETWLVTSELLSALDRPRDALALLSNIKAGDPFAGGVAGTRIKLLVDAGETQTALAQAQAEVAREDAGAAQWTRLGDLYNELGRLGEAADAYGKALERAAAEGSDQPTWPLWLLKGGALEQADRWPEAKAALETAYKLAPQQAIVMNYLGYAQLERGENVDEAMKLVTEASRLDPDSAEITDSLGWAHYLRGNLPKAIELLEKAARGRQSDAEIHEHLGDAYHRAGRRFEARYAWQAALLYAEGKDAERLRDKIGGRTDPGPNAR